MAGRRAVTGQADGAPPRRRCLHRTALVESKPAGSPHSTFEDALALFTGTAFVALGVALYTHAGPVTGGTAGIALLVQYASGWPFGAVFFVLNLPFVWLAVRTLG